MEAISPLTAEEASAVNNFKETIQRDTEGRYIVNLPRKQFLEECSQKIQFKQVFTGEEGNMGSLPEECTGLHGS